jgi:hypothetical protein
MTDEKVIELYKKANGWGVEGWEKTIKELKQFAALVAASEREACANVLDEMAEDAERDHEPSVCVRYYREKAAAIRARG